MRICRLLLVLVCGNDGCPVFGLVLRVLAGIGVRRGGTLASGGSIRVEAKKHSKKVHDGHLEHPLPHQNMKYAELNAVPGRFIGRRKFLARDTHRYLFTGVSCPYIVRAYRTNGWVFAPLGAKLLPFYLAALFLAPG